MENVKPVAENIEREILTADRNRKWGDAMCDGVPYDMVAKLQDRYKVCSSCSDMISLDELEVHKLSHKETITYSMPFPNMYFRPGPGHIEMNMARKLLSFAWEPIIKHVAYCLLH